MARLTVVSSKSEQLLAISTARPSLSDSRDYMAA
jgi:hypothetical protein